MFELIRVRDHGWLLPRHRLAFVKKPVGDLVVGEEYLEDLHRHARVARLARPGSGGFMDEVPLLYDVTLLKWTKGLVILSGFERVPDEKEHRSIDVAQTWMLYEVGVDSP